MSLSTNNNLSNKEDFSLLMSLPEDLVKETLGHLEWNILFGITQVSKKVRKLALDVLLKCADSFITKNPFKIPHNPQWSLDGEKEAMCAKHANLKLTVLMRQRNLKGMSDFMDAMGENSHVRIAYLCHFERILKDSEDKQAAQELNSYVQKEEELLEKK